MLRCRVLILALDGGLAVRAEGDYADRDTEVALHEANVVLEFLRELAFLADFRQVFLPAWELGVDRLDLGGDINRNLVGLHAVHLVGGAASHSGEDGR